MKHLRPFNENFDESDVNELNDLLIDLKEYFDIEVRKVNSGWIQIRGKLESKSFSISEISKMFDEFLHRIIIIYDNKLNYDLKFQTSGIEIKVDINRY